MRQVIVILCALALSGCQNFAKQFDADVAAAAEGALFPSPNRTPANRKLDNDYLENQALLKTARDNAIDNLSAAAGAPAIADAPVAKDQPVAANAPAAVDKPVVASAPAAKDQPVAATAPAAKDQPVAANAPAAKDQSVAATAPAAKEQPVAAAKPGQVEALTSIGKACWSGS